MFDELIAKHYPGHHEDGHLIAFFTDFICWARDFRKRPCQIIEMATNHCGIVIPENGVPAMLRGLDYYSDQPLVGEVEIDWGDFPEAMHEGMKISKKKFAERAAFFASLLKEYAPQLDDVTATIHLVKEAFVSCDDPIRVFHTLHAAMQRTNNFGGCGVLTGDEFYSRDDLIEFLSGDADAADDLMRKVGYDPTEDKLIPGAEINKWLRPPADD